MRRGHVIMPRFVVGTRHAMRRNRRTLSRLLAHRAGARLETPVIDDGSGTFDAEGHEWFIVTIPAMHRDVAHMMVIPHINKMNDRVPTIIDRRNTARGSRWEIR
jgi:exonuclease SbcC